MSLAIRVTLLAALAGAAAPLVAAEAVSGQGADFFEKKIRPVLVANCYQCHSASAKELKGELRLDTKEGLRKGGESGAIIVAGKPDESLLVQSLRHENGMEMPPQKKLPDEVIADFVKWVEMGAPDPRAANTTTVGGKYNKIDARKHWSFQPPKVVPPALKDAAWPRTEIDKYILAGVERKQLRPVADADKETLIRRVTFDLVGLPPTPQEIDAFVSDQSSNALEKVIDRLLASPQFGERWGRHWLDVARYGESTGKERNVPFPNAWRYRDYVYDAFNADKPYDQFVREQVAGDLLPAKNDAEKNEHLVATGFLTLGPKSLNQRNREQYLMDQVDEQIDVATRAVIAISVACARCHDHKFDPIPQTDYYALAGIFKSTDVFAGVRAGNNKTGYSGEHLSLIESGAKKPASSDDRRELIRLRDELERAEKELTAVKANAGKPDAANARPAVAAGKNAKQKAKQKAKREQLARQKANPVARQERAVADLKQQIRDLEAKISPPGEPVMAARESDRIANCRVNIRGEVNDLGPEVPRGFVSVLTTAQSPKVNVQQSGRLQLAVWLSQKSNPLTARVMVNRIWYHLFGRGIVETVDNFGALSEAPTHPELLDYLAIRFMDNGWSVKKSIKEIMLSRTYQLSSEHNEANYAADPDNKLVWRMSRRRLDAEVIRDSILAVSGQLDLKRPQGSLTQEISGGEIGRQARTEALKRPVTFRSAYLPLVRGLVPEILNVFDVADPELVVGQRDVTTVATQALFLMNSPFVQEQAQQAAKRILAEPTASDEARVDLAFRLAVGRLPEQAERQSALAFLRDFEQSLESSRPLEEKRRAAWTGLCHSLFASAEFRYVY
ncbi:MAG TPA: PSD1 and planctomycete cytochrome C domain-containing protein [Pirellulaceae bacterium]|nr:PSD1 and planctomycete cytochrome C domain-containing protein [Pirellulaceae bacterium]